MLLIVHVNGMWKVCEICSYWILNLPECMNLHMKNGCLENSDLKTSDLENSDPLQNDWNYMNEYYCN